MKRWKVYILLCSDGSLYTGATNHLGKRVAEHNSGKGAKYTRSRRPVRVVYTEFFMGKGEALKREHVLKRLSRQDKLILIRSQQ